VSRHYPALDLRSPAPLDDERVAELIAEIDDLGPTAVQEHDGGIRVFFSSSEDRARAAAQLAHHAGLVVAPADVSDENWAERSQAALGPVLVGRLVITPPWRMDEAQALREASGAAMATVVIQPSMGFGTGHHATTRLCLMLLQRAAPANRRVLDVGAGSGVLAIAAWRLGASAAVAIDNDPDAVSCARENVVLNAAVAIDVRLMDLGDGPGTPLAGLGRFDVVLANLTGAALVSHAPAISAALAPEGRLIVSGCLQEEVETVTAAFRARKLQASDRLDEDEWTALAFDRKSTT
jgi:ribosomal protein L11 methyltransferase